LRLSKMSDSLAPPANGIISMPEINGYVYCAGNAVVGFPCVAPILDLTNSTKGQVSVFYSSRAAKLDLTQASKQLLLPGERALVVGMLPASVGTGPPGPPMVSYVAVRDDITMQLSVFALIFGNGFGYQLQSAVGAFSGNADGSLSAASPNSPFCVTPTQNAFALTTCGCQQPNWRSPIIYTAAISQAGCRNYNALRPCPELNSWVLA
jgi:hypothetical protein